MRKPSRLLVYLLLIIGSAVFAFPFLWMASTSVKVDRELFSEDTAPMLAVIGVSRPDARYSDLFKLVGICNYPVEQFAYKVRKSWSKEYI